MLNIYAGDIHIYNSDTSNNNSSISNNKIKSKNNTSFKKIFAFLSGFMIILLPITLSNELRTTFVKNPIISFKSSFLTDSLDEDIKKYDNQLSYDQEKTSLQKSLEEIELLCDKINNCQFIDTYDQINYKNQFQELKSKFESKLSELNKKEVAYNNSLMGVE